MSTVTGASLDLDKARLGKTPYNTVSLKWLSLKRAPMTFSTTHPSSTVVSSKRSLSQIAVDRHLAVNSKKESGMLAVMMVRVGAYPVGRLKRVLIATGRFVECPVPRVLAPVSAECLNEHQISTPSCKPNGVYP